MYILHATVSGRKFQILTPDRPACIRRTVRRVRREAQRLVFASPLFKELPTPSFITFGTSATYSHPQVYASETISCFVATNMPNPLFQSKTHVLGGSMPFRSRT